MRNEIAANLMALGLALAPFGATAEEPTAATPSAPGTVQTTDWSKPILDSDLRYLVLGDQLEFRANDGDDLLRWDVEAWVGGDYNRVWLITEGEGRTSGPSGGDAEFQVLYGRTIAPFWDLQAGVRQDVLFGSGKDRERTFAVIGVAGLAPYWFELTPALFLSDDADVSARLTATYDVLFTQRLIAQPRFEVNVAANDARKFGIESGFNDLELGLRVRYEIRREFAPYIGVNWVRQLGDTSDLARDEGDDVDVIGGVVGIRLWF